MRSRSGLGLWGRDSTSLQYYFNPLTNWYPRSYKMEQDSFVKKLTLYSLSNSLSYRLGEKKDCLLVLHRPTVFGRSTKKVKSFPDRPTKISSDRKCFLKSKVFKKFSRPTNRDFTRPKHVKRFSRPTDRDFLWKTRTKKKKEEKKRRKKPDRPTPSWKSCGGQANNLFYFLIWDIVMRIKQALNTVKENFLQALSVY